MRGISLYSRLFTYRERPDSTPLENFLTEALADLLNRLPGPEIRDFLSANFLPCDASPRWLSAGTGTDKWLWRTQLRITTDNGTEIPDLVLEIEKRPTLLVEVKVDSPIGRGDRSPDYRERPDPIDELPIGSLKNVQAATDQLARYDNWLLSQVSEPDQAAIVLLSRATRSPDRFRERVSVNGLHQRHCHWHQVWTWLRRRTAAGDGIGQDPNAVWQVLGKQLATFLKEQNMASEFMDSRDLAVSELIVSSNQRIETTIDHVAAGVRTELAGLLTQGGHDFEYNSEGGAIIGWLYLKRPAETWEVVWGIRFPAQSSWWTDASPPLPPLTHAFIYMYNLGRKVLPKELVDLAEGTPGWQVIANNQLVAAKPLHEFPSDPDQMTIEMAHWARERIAAIKPIIKKLVQP